MWKPLLSFKGDIEVISSKSFGLTDCPSSWLCGLSHNSSINFFGLGCCRFYFFFFYFLTFSSMFIVCLLFCSTRYPTYTFKILFSMITLRMYSKSFQDWIRLVSKLFISKVSSFMYTISFESLRNGLQVRKPLRIVAQMSTSWFMNSCLKLSAFLISC